LREAQRRYQEAADSLAISAERWREIEARSFSRLVLALHGAKLPWWLQKD